MDRHQKTRAQRAKVLSLARTLARTGHYPDGWSVIAQLGPLDPVTRSKLQEIHGQLDRLCALAQPGWARFDIPGREWRAATLAAELVAESTRMSTTAATVI